MKNILRLVGLPLLYSVIFLGGLGAQQELEPRVEAAIRQLNMVPFKDVVTAVDFQLPGLDAEIYGLDDYPNSLVMLNFWASWCGPCRAEMPSMQGLYSDFSPKGLEIIAINQRESRDIAATFMNQFGYTFPALLDAQGTMGFQYGVRSIPLTYLITPDKRIIAGKPGAQDWNTPEIRGAIQTLIDYYIQ